MIYKSFQDLKLSALGVGTMRLPVMEGDDARIDEAAAEKMFDLAIREGVNYFDTAWGYHSGNSELVTGKLLSRYPRESFYLASKFPGYDLSNMDKVEEIFEQQLKKCRVEYFDFYLIHNVCEMNIDDYVDPKHGILDYLLKQKANGRIRHLGFSAHGSRAVMERFLETYGPYMEFCQIQLNWIDWDFQDAKGKVELLNARNLPVWVMEPLRGGRLTNLADEDAARLKALRPEENVPAWAFRFLQSVPGVTMILSGMSNLAQLEDNLHTFREDRPLTEEEMATLLDIGHRMATGVPCTACHYCTSHCPQGLNIPELLKFYNEHTFTGGGFLAPMFISTLPEDKRPSACLACRSCEAVCPQQIKVSEVLADFAEKLNG